MINRITIATTQSFPLTLKYTNIRSYIFAGAFVSLSVAVPWIFHQFHLAGPTFLPMHIFVLTAGLLFGWRVGLLVGLFAPLANYAIAGMPMLQILPQITIELSVYGMVAGVLRERFNLRSIWSLLGAMIAGRLALLLGVLMIYFIAGQVYSPLGPETSPFLAVWSAIKQGGPGIVIQLALIPVAIWLMGKMTTQESGS